MSLVTLGLHSMGLRSLSVFSLGFSITQWVLNRSMGLRSFGGTSVTQCVFAYAVITQWVFGHAMGFRSLSKSSHSASLRSGLRSLMAYSAIQPVLGHTVGLQSLRMVSVN